MPAVSDADTVHLRMANIGIPAGHEALLPILLESLPPGGVLPPMRLLFSVGKIEQLSVLGVESSPSCLLPDSVLQLHHPASSSIATLTTLDAVPVSTTGVLCYLRVQSHGGVTPARYVFDCNGAEFLGGGPILRVTLGSITVHDNGADDVVELLDWDTGREESWVSFIARCQGAPLLDLRPEQTLVTLEDRVLPILAMEGGEYGSPYRVRVRVPCDVDRPRVLRVDLSAACANEIRGTWRVYAYTAEFEIHMDGPRYLCDRDSCILSAPEGFTSYQWSTGERTRSIVARKGGWYTVTAEDSTGFCAWKTAHAFVDAPAAPVVQPSGNFTLCRGRGQELRVEGQYPAYEWSTGESTPSITVTSPGYYWVEVRDSSGCRVRSEEVRILVVDSLRPRIMYPQNRILCPGDTLLLYVDTQYDDYLWSTGERTPTIKVTAAGSYWVYAAHANGCSGTSHTVELLQPQPNPPVISAATTEVCAGDSVLVSVDDPGVDRLWMDGSRGETLLVGKTSKVAVRVRYASGCEVRSNELTITVHANPNKPYISRAGDTLRSTPGTTYQWLLEGQAISGATDATYIAQSTGLYQVRITNEYGCAGLSFPYPVNALGVSTPPAVSGYVIEVYPQPAEGVLTVRTGEGGVATLRVTLTDLLGREVLRRDVRTLSANEDITLDVHALPRGNYLLGVEGTRGRALRVIALW